MDPDELDLMSLLEDSDIDHALVPAVGSDLDSNQALGVVPNGDEMQLAVCATDQKKPCSVPDMRGKVGQGRHGGQHEKNLLALHMRHAKMLRSNHGFRSEVAEFLQDSCFTKDGKLLSISAKTTAKGMVLSLECRSKVGNRFQRRIPWMLFLKAAYGKLNRSSHIALALETSNRSVRFMTTLVGQIFMNQQLVVLAKLVVLANAIKPTMFIRQIKWDETQLLCSANVDKSDHRVHGTVGHASFCYQAGLTISTMV